jgi:protein-L-isoaspartate O-methyltransferase
LFDKQTEEIMKIRSGAQFSKFQRMERAVRETERELMRRRTNKSGRTKLFITSAPFKGVYAPLPTDIFMLHIGRCPELRPEFSLADLGSGLGELCFVASFHFQKVVGYEMDSELIREADNIRKRIGFDNVVFRQEDFLKADLSGFDALTVYQPFVDNFVPLMAERLLNTRPGTYIICSISSGMRQNIFEGGGHFRRLAAESPKTGWGDLLETYQRLF